MNLSRFARSVIPFAFAFCLLSDVRPTLAEDAATSLSIATDYVTIEGSWPHTGVARVDEESEAFVRLRAKDFETEIMDIVKDIKPEDRDEMMETYRFPYEMTIANEVSEPTPRSVCILWNIWSYTGGAHGQLEMVAANYDRQTGSPLALENLFADPDEAIRQFSRVARERLGGQPDGKDSKIDSPADIPPDIPEDMMRAGTEPVKDNFAIFTLLPDGIRLHFPPYQVAPWSSGPQAVDVPLSELAKARPNLDYWGKA